LEGSEAAAVDCWAFLLLRWIKFGVSEDGNARRTVVEYKVQYWLDVNKNDENENTDIIDELLSPRSGCSGIRKEALMHELASRQVRVWSATHVPFGRSRLDLRG
jgi:hypothetical protein